MHLTMHSIVIFKLLHCFTAYASCVIGVSESDAATTADCLTTTDNFHYG